MDRRSFTALVTGAVSTTLLGAGARAAAPSGRVASRRAPARG